VVAAVLLTLGVLAALGAAVLYALGLVMQAVEVRAGGDQDALTASLLRRLVRRPRWIAGTLLAAAGWPLQTAALLAAPLTVVQPTLAVGLVVLLVAGARTLGEPVGWRELAAVLAVAAGVAMVAVAAPERASGHPSAAAVVVALTVLGIGALAPYLLRRSGRPWTIAAALGAGLAYAASGITTKLTSDALAQHALEALLVWLALTGIAAGLGTTSEMSALARLPAAHVGPLVFAVQTLVPVAAAPLLAGEAWPADSGGRVTLAAGLLLVLSGAGALAASGPVAALVARSVSSTSTGSAERLRRPSRATRSRTRRWSAARAAPRRSTTTSPARGDP
jgi:drug/metabolite transporter (DMT)-like permease